MSKKVSNSQKRIVELMEYYHINQTELCRKTGLQKSALSNYLNGDREPRQSQISLIADPFNINPAWLMGYDVPMFNQMPEDTEHARAIRKLYAQLPADILEDSGTLTEAIELVKDIEDLPPEKRSQILAYIKFLKSDL